MHGSPARDVTYCPLDDSFKPQTNFSSLVLAPKKPPRLEICKPEKNAVKVKKDENYEASLLMSPIIALESNSRIKKG